MRRILLKVAYDGTAYCGWQIQPGVPTIEGVLNAELTKLCCEPISVIGASRTDAGVHAKGAIAVFDTDCRIPAEKFSYALNTGLPEDIRVNYSMEVPLDFHPRRTQVRKTYEYSIWHDEFPDPLRRLYSHHIYTRLDVEAMKEAAKAFVGEHDFVGFCSVHTQAETTVRTIYDLGIKVEYPGKCGDSDNHNKSEGCNTEAADTLNASDTFQITISVTGNGFLYNMVRIIAGTLIEVGQGKIDPADMADIIASGDRKRAGNTAPAKGLCLVSYEYPEYPEI